MTIGSTTAKCDSYILDDDNPIGSLDSSPVANGHGDHLVDTKNSDLPIQYPTPKISKNYNHNPNHNHNSTLRSIHSISPHSPPSPLLVEFSHHGTSLPHQSVTFRSRSTRFDSQGRRWSGRVGIRGYSAPYLLPVMTRLVWKEQPPVGCILAWRGADQTSWTLEAPSSFLSFVTQVVEVDKDLYLKQHPIFSKLVQGMQLKVCEY